MTASTTLLILAVLAAGFLSVVHQFRPLGRGAVVGITVAACACAVVGIAERSEEGVTAVRRVPATSLPGGTDGQVEEFALRTSDGRDLVLSHYGSGAYLGTNTARIEAFAGADGGTGELGVRSRLPRDGNDGALLYARDAGDKYNLGLDFRESARPSLRSDSPFPLRVVTPRGADLQLRPGSSSVPPGSSPPRRAARVSVFGDLHVGRRRPLSLDARGGFLTLPRLPRLPVNAPNGSLALVGDRLMVKLGRWVQIR